MPPKVLFIVNIDGDPDPETTPPDNPAVLAKYRVMEAIVAEHADGKGAFGVQTSPMYRHRFFDEPFAAFWHDWVQGGGELTLHPEEDLYCAPDDRLPDGTHYADAARMQQVIADGVATLARIGLTFSAYKNGYQAQTPAILRHLHDAGIGIEMSCAPGIHWPEKLADWRNAPLSAFMHSPARMGEIAQPGDPQQLFEIPVGWSGLPSATPERLLNTQYLVNEFSNSAAIATVWDMIARRAQEEGRDQIVSFLCHTYTMADSRYADRLRRALDYMTAHGGQPVTPGEARLHFEAQAHRQ
ncbi:MAG: hypothetical protein H3C51_09790 [Rubellimicrobium sp.]|nr:hypothetical protein [Rubellimicrobium sp.]